MDLKTENKFSHKPPSNALLMSPVSVIFSPSLIKGSCHTFFLNLAVGSFILSKDLVGFLWQPWKYATWISLSEGTCQSALRCAASCQPLVEMSELMPHSSQAAPRQWQRKVRVPGNDSLCPTWDSANDTFLPALPFGLAEISLELHRRWRRFPPLSSSSPLLCLWQPSHWGGWRLLLPPCAFHRRHSQ